MTMFANQSQFAQRVGATHGTGPAWAGQGGMSSPSFGSGGYGHQFTGMGYNTSPGGAGVGMVGGMNQFAGGAALGLGVAGGFGMLGHAGGYLDPFTGTGRAFMAGRAGQAGMAGIGRGMMAAAPVAGAYMAAGSAMAYAGDQMYQGAQSVNQVGGMMQGFMGPSFGAPGGFRPGGRQNRQEMLNVVQSLNEMAGDDVMVTLQSAKTLMDKVGQMGMLTGATDAASFKTKFKAAVGQIRSIAKIMGTTLEEAAPLLGEMQKMGMWSTSDVMGTSVSMKAVGGAATPFMAQAMQQGAQQSWQQGGSMASGALGGRESFMATQGLMRTGAISHQDLMAFTGGVGGARGQMMMSQRLTGSMQGLMRHPMGNLMMAGLGATEGGRFTGGVDQDRMQSFLSGGLSFDDLVSQGRKATRTRAGAASFSFNSDSLRQNVASEGGLAGLAKGIEGVLNKSGFANASEDIQGIMIQKLTGKSQQDAQMIQKVMGNITRALDDAERRRRDALHDSLRQVDEKERSMAGYMDQIGNEFERSVSAPLQSFGAQAATRFSQGIDRMGDQFFGRDRGTFSMTRRGEQKLMLSLQGRGLQTINPGGSLSELASKGPMQLFGPSRSEQLLHVGAPTRTTHRSEPMRPGEMVLKEGRFQIRANEGLVAHGAKRRIARGQGGSLGYEGEPEVDSLKRSFTSWQIGAGRGALRNRAEGGGRMTTDEAAKSWLGTLSPSQKKAMQRLNDKTGRGDTLEQTAADMAALAIKEDGDPTGFGPNPMADGQRMGWTELGAFLDPKAAAELTNNSVDDVTSALNAAGNPYAEGQYGMGELFHAAVGGLTGNVGDTVTNTEVHDAMKNESWGTAMMDWVQGGMTGENAFTEAAGGGDANARRLLNAFKDASSGSIGKIKEGFKGFQTAQFSVISKKRADRISGMARGERNSLSLGLSGQVGEDYASILAGLESGKEDQIAEAIALAESAGGGLNSAMRKKLGGSGGGAAGMMAAFGQVGHLKGGSRASFGKQMGKLSQYANFDVLGTLMADDRGRGLVEDSLSNGNIDAGEMEGIAEMLKKVLRLGPEDRKAKKGHEERLMMLLSDYARVNTEFVQAVGGAIPELLKDYKGSGKVTEAAGNIVKATMDAKVN
jgi:hypothetical protein